MRDYYLGEDEIKITKEEIFDHLKIARERLESSEVLLDTGHYRDSISRSYYAFLDAANILLLTKGIIAKTHEGISKLFSLHFVNTGLVDKKYGRWFKRALKSRREADYNKKKIFTQQDAQEALKEASEFVKVIEELIPDLLKKQV